MVYIKIPVACIQYNCTHVLIHIPLPPQLDAALFGQLLAAGDAAGQAARGGAVDSALAVFVPPLLLAGCPYFFFAAVHAAEGNGFIKLLASRAVAIVGDQAADVRWQPLRAGLLARSFLLGAQLLAAWGVFHDDQEMG